MFAQITRHCHSGVDNLRTIGNDHRVPQGNISTLHKQYKKGKGSLVIITASNPPSPRPLYYLLHYQTDVYISDQVCLSLHCSLCHIQLYA